MLDGDEIKQILYTVIEDRGREKIQAEITSSMDYRKNILIMMMQQLQHYARRSFILCLQFVLYHQKEKSKSKTI